MHYRLNVPTDKHAAAIFAATVKLLETDTQMKADRENLLNVCCAPSMLVAITASRALSER